MKEIFTSIESISARLIFVLTVLVSFTLFTFKLSFLLAHVEEGLLSVYGVYLFAINFAPYLGVCVWVYLLFLRQTPWYLHVYVLFVGLIITTLVRLVESGAEVTLQGVDFEFVNHLVLAVFGHGGWEEFAFLWSIRLGLFLLLAFGICLKVLGSGRQLERLPLGVFLLSLVISFLPASGSSFPKSLSSNGFLYVVKTAWFPIEEIPRTNSQFQFGHQQVYQKNDEYFSALKGKNVALIILESTSANMLSFYQDSDSLGETTPFLSSLSENALVVSETSSTMNSTSKSLVNILCGIEPYLKTDVFEVTLGLPVDCLPTRLTQEGYTSTFFQSATYHYEGRDRLVDRAGFKNFISVDSLPIEKIESAQMIGPLGREDKVLLEAHRKWITQQVESEKPFLSVYLTLAQHHPYLPADFDESFRHFSDDAYLNNFTNALSYIDEYLSEVFEHYKQAGLYEDTVFVIVGDHGESFARYHLPRFHNNVLYREGLWVPFMIVHEDLFSEKVKLEGEFSLFDVAPSIEYLLGVETKSAYRGQPIFSVSKERKLHAACWYKKRCLSTFDRHYKYIFNYDDMPEELYARQGDLREQNNLAETNPEIVEQYRAETFAWYNDILSGYEKFYSELDKNFLEKPESYYKFPSEIIPDQEEIRKW